MVVLHGCVHAGVYFQGYIYSYSFTCDIPKIAM